MRFALAGPPAVIASCALLTAMANACTRTEPPSPVGSPSVALPAIPPGVASPAVRRSDATDRAPAPPRAAAADGPPPPIARAPAASVPSIAIAPAASVHSIDGAPAAPTRSLDVATAASAVPSASPQTTERPQTTGAAFQARVRGLWQAIVDNDPAAAMPFFFPLDAYRVVKDVADPAADWRRRLVAAYERDVHELHARLGAAADRATLLGLDVPSARARWVDPGEEWNRIGYFRVFGSALRYSIDGHERAISVRSLISWRGEWYVVHLRGP